MYAHSASTVVATSASLKRVFWKSMIRSPNASRSFVYASVHFERGLGGRGGGDADREALERQVHHELDEALALLAADEVLFGDEDVAERQLGGVVALEAHLVELLAVVEAVHAVLDEQQAEGVRPVALAGLDERDDDVGGLAARDEGLRAVDDVAALDLLGGGLDAAQVAARAGLAHREGAEDLAGRHAREPLLLLLLRAHVHDVGDGEVVLDAEGAGERAGAGADHLFVDDRAEAVVLQHAGAAELLGNREADEARLARGEHRRAVDLALGVPALARLVVT